jgi:hypothetical protein
MSRNDPDDGTGFEGHLEPSKPYRITLMRKTTHCDKLEFTGWYDTYSNRVYEYGDSGRSAELPNIRWVTEVATPWKRPRRTPKLHKPRTNRSLVLSYFKRYPQALVTAWQVGKFIGRNPASVSSEMHKMSLKGLVSKVLIESADTAGRNTSRILYAAVGSPAPKPTAKKAKPSHEVPKRKFNFT